MGLPRKNRGEFRPFYEALWDGPQFRALTPNAKLCFVYAKGLSGANGLKVWPVLDHSLAERTGIPLPGVRKAIAELIASDWLQYEDNIVWVVRGLAFEPQLSPDNPLHRKGVRNALQGLPSAPIVARFREHYAAYFVDDMAKGFESPDKPIRNQPPSPSPTPSPSPSPSPSPFPTTTTAGDEAAVQDRGKWLVVAANKGVIEKYGEQPHPIRATAAASYHAINAMAEAGVDFDFAAPVIFDYAKNASTSDGRPPQSLKYFTAYVIGKWEAEKARREAASYQPNTSLLPQLPRENDQMRNFAIKYARDGEAEWITYCEDRNIPWEKAA